MSFLGDAIGELLVSALEGVIWRNRPASHFPEGHENASLGCVAGFLGFMSLLIGLPGFIFAVSSGGIPGPGGLFILGFGAGSALFAIGAIRVGRKALVVTQRNAVLSHLSRAIGCGALIASSASSILGLVSVIRWLT
jgi:hypothetical protein